MAEIDWHKCKFLESAENLKPLVKKRFGREPSSSVAREIAACLLQGRLFYEAAASSPLEIRPLQQFYGMIGFAKAIIVASRLNALSTLRPAHGLTDISAGNSRIADLRLRIESSGTFQEFNDVMAPLVRLCYLDNSSRFQIVPLPSANSAELRGVELSLPEILGRVPILESLYQLTFGEEAYTSSLDLQAAFQGDSDFRIRINDSQLFADRKSLKQIVGRWRSRFPFLRLWRLQSAQHGWGYSTIYFRNVRNRGIDEFSEAYLGYQDGMFQELAVPDDANVRFPLEEAFSPVAGCYTGANIYAVSPIGGFYVSEFSIQYLGLFLLSSLMRYRPQIWTHAISRSSVPGEPADDKALSLIERFLDLNGMAIPEMVVQVLNPYEDDFV